MTTGKQDMESPVAQLKDARYWPARDAYLRRGTPVHYDGHDCLIDSRVVVPLGVDDYRRVVTPRRGDSWWSTVTIAEIYLDLADPTARAHAAWAWRQLWGDFLNDALKPSDFDHLRVFALMASGNESVSVTEARAALGFAESWWKEEGREGPMNVRRMLDEAAP